MNIGFCCDIVFRVAGGLGIFLLGMKNMSEGMQAVAGDKIRKMINALTNNRLFACGVGTLVTSIIQSSSVTTVMVVGMVNAGIMTLMQAIGVIIGANIGTTVTAWILVLKIGKYGLPLIGLSAFFYLFSKSDKVRFAASVFMGLGMVFFGLELMKGGFSPLRDMPEFIEWFSKFSPDTYFGVIKCCLVGAALTAIVQSSSATLGITMGLALTGIIDFPTAAALVLGENIGTTITAYLASLGASVNAKRASYAHIILNTLGVIIVTAAFPLYIKLVLYMLGQDPAFTVYTDTGTTYPHASAGIALTHTTFNVLNAMIWLPLMSLLVKFLNKIVPDKSFSEKPHLKYIDFRMVDAPAIAIEQSRKEIIWMSGVISKMLENLRRVLNNGPIDTKLEEQIFEKERELDVVQKEVSEFLSHLLSGTVTQDVMLESRKQLRMADELESISDYISNILKLRLKLRDMSIDISSYGTEDLLDLHSRVKNYIEFINEALRTDNRQILTEAQAKGKIITEVMKEHRSEHLTRVENGQVQPLKSLIYMDMLNAYRRIKDHAFNIAEVLSGEK